MVTKAAATVGGRPPAGALRVVFTGSMPGGEQFSTGFWMRDTGVHDEATANAQAHIMLETGLSNDASGAWRMWIKLFCTVDVEILLCQTYLYDGTSTRASVIGAAAPANRVKGESTRHLPNQVAACLTLRTGLAGRRNRGRMYLPANGAFTDDQGQMATADVQAFLNAWRLYFQDVDASDAGKIVVCSITGSVMHDVTGLAMDSRLDIQRRRAASQKVESRLTAVITP